MSVCWCRVWGSRCRCSVHVAVTSLYGQKSSFVQFYPQVGIAAMCEATGNSADCEWLERGYAAAENLWDATPSGLGYHDVAELDWSAPRGKGFTPTGDALTTTVIPFNLLSRTPDHLQRLNDVCAGFLDHLVPAMDAPGVLFGFPEQYSSDWQIDPNQGWGSVGHLLKSAWVLARAHLLSPHTQYVAAARELLIEVWVNGGYDMDHGGPFGDLDWRTGTIQPTKVHWVLEQAVTAGLSNYYISTSVERNVFLRIADESLQFFFDHIYDDELGEGYVSVTADGSTVTTDAMGDIYKGAYHNIEMSYFVYLYGNLLLHGTPVELYYRFEPTAAARYIQLSPLAIEDGRLQIAAVELDGVSFTNFDATSRTISLAADEGGELKVTFAIVY